MAEIPAAAQVLVDFQPKHDFFVGIDSDGCAMDAMDIKHLECFTPAYILAWDLQPVSTLARETAVFVNLKSITRGLNRWLALRQLLDLLRDRAEVAERGVTIPDYPELTDFIDSKYPLSDKGLAAWAAENPSETADRMIRWGDNVNDRIAEIVHNSGPFPGVRAAMEALDGKADQIVVSATPVHSLEREWAEHGLDQFMSVIAGQEMGGKAQHVQYAAKGKYPGNENIMLVGDAPGDRDAAAQEGVLYYPILPGKEKFSWKRFKDEGIGKFLDGTFAGEYQQMLIDEFTAMLPDEVPWETVSGNKKLVMPTVKS
nr:HAD hydrolase-like protein [Actinomycetales bacterium]